MENSLVHKKRLPSSMETRRSPPYSVSVPRVPAQDQTLSILFHQRCHSSICDHAILDGRCRWHRQRRDVGETTCALRLQAWNSEKCLKHRSLLRAAVLVFYCKLRVAIVEAVVIPRITVVIVHVSLANVLQNTDFIIAALQYGQSFIPS